MPKKILLADDSITIQKVVELTFSDGDYEVTAVNNGSKAIQKLSEMRPDIILSDIIMPEKNGYEVCEFVKSHPDYRNIPVVLLTGTFEPFDPDRADKAGCDAVVTKPFESQSLIQKVDELIEAGRSKAPTAPAESPAPAPAAESPWSDEAPTAPARVPFSFAPAPPPEQAPAAKPAPSPEGFTHDSEVFGAAKPSRPTTEMPFETAGAEAFSGETRAIPKVTPEQMREQVSTQAFPPPGAAPPEPPPPPPPSFSGETRAFPKMSFEDFPPPARETAPPPRPEPPAAPSEESPFGAPPPAETFSGETRAFPKMSFDDLSKGASPPPPAPSSSASLWDETPPSPTPMWSPPPEKREELREREIESVAEAPAGGERMDLTDEQIDRIARRVVQLMSDQLVRNIAWEVIPDLAEMVVKERIRQLEGE